MAITTNTPDRLQLGVGDFYWDSNDLGAVAKTASFGVEQEVYWPELGGSKGRIAGTGWVVGESATLAVTLHELTLTNFSYVVPGLVVSSDGTSEYNTVPVLGLIALTDHKTVKWVGVNAAGKAVEVHLFRALPEPGISWTVDDNGIWGMEVTFRSSYLSTAATTRCWQIYVEE